MTTKQTIIEKLLGTKRDGIENLVEYLEDNGFFTSPASSRYHGVYEGGLAEHSLSVLTMFTGMNKRLRLGVDQDSCILAGLLHDVCKVGAYIKTEKGYKVNFKKPDGHARLSLERIEEYISLKVIEELMIQYHMGVYHLKEFEEKTGEYRLRNRGLAYAWFHNPAVKFFHICDQIVEREGK